MTNEICCEMTKEEMEVGSYLTHAWNLFLKLPSMVDKDTVDDDLNDFRKCINDAHRIIVTRSTIRRLQQREHHKCCKPEQANSVPDLPVGSEVFINGFPDWGVITETTCSYEDCGKPYTVSFQNPDRTVSGVRPSDIINYRLPKDKAETPTTNGGS